MSLNRPSSLQHYILAILGRVMTWANTIDWSLLRAWTNVDKGQTVTAAQLSDFPILTPLKSTSTPQTESSNKRRVQTLIFYDSSGFWDSSCDFPLQLNRISP